MLRQQIRVFVSTDDGDVTGWTNEIIHPAACVCVHVCVCVCVCVCGVHSLLLFLPHTHKFKTTTLLYHPTLPHTSESSPSLQASPLTCFHTDIYILFFFSGQIAENFCFCQEKLPPHQFSLVLTHFFEVKLGVKLF